MNLSSLKGPESETQYQNIKYFTKGGMGELYEATDIVNHHNVAIKIIMIDNEESMQLLKSEADIALRLEHPNIIKTYYVNEGNVKKERFYYIVMDFMEKGNLKELLSQYTSMVPLDEALIYMKDILSGLNYAHNTIIHRDLKPLNILVNKNGRLLICDFGVAKYVDSKTRTKTLKGSGTLPYMAPECWLNTTNSVSMDIYSLGIIFFEILTLTKPFKGPTDEEFRDQHLFNNLPKLLDFRNGLPIKLVEIIQKMTSKKTVDRYKTVKEIIEVLDTIDLKQDINLSKNESILKLANQKTHAVTQVRLEEQKRAEAQKELKKQHDYVKSQLIKQYVDRINELNQDLQNEKIKVEEREHTLRISFYSKYADVTFFSLSVEAMIGAHHQVMVSRFGHQYGNPGQYLMLLEKDGIKIIGKVSTNFSNSSSGSKVWGYNILWHQQDYNDFYGQWTVVWFVDNMLHDYSSHIHYPMDENKFIKAYEQSNAISMTSMNRENHLNAIEELIRDLVS